MPNGRYPQITQVSALAVKRSQRSAESAQSADARLSMSLFSHTTAVGRLPRPSCHFYQLPGD